MNTEVHIVTCPACGQPSRYAANNLSRPFCSANCKNRDLGAWASEDFRIPEDCKPECNSSELPLQ